jgi:hypothetical protein
LENSLFAETGGDYLMIPLLVSDEGGIIKTFSVFSIHSANLITVMISQFFQHKVN